MTEDEIFSQTNAFYKGNKIVIPNMHGVNKVKSAWTLAMEMFPTAQITVNDDPLQEGAMFLQVKDIDFTVREMMFAHDLIKDAETIEIFSEDEDCVISIGFRNVYKIKKM